MDGENNELGPEEDQVIMKVLPSNKCVIKTLWVRPGGFVTLACWVITRLWCSGVRHLLQRPGDKNNSNFPPKVNQQRKQQEAARRTNTTRLWPTDSPVVPTEKHSGRPRRSSSSTRRLRQDRRYSHYDSFIFKKVLGSASTVPSQLRLIWGQCLCVMRPPPLLCEEFRVPAVECEPTVHVTPTQSYGFCTDEKERHRTQTSRRGRRQEAEFDLWHVFTEQLHANDNQLKKTLWGNDVISR